MSPRAACRLEHLGFKKVYDYVTGISDWKAAGHPVEGTPERRQQVAEATRPDIPTCEPDERLDRVTSRLTADDWETCVVVDCDGLVVGRLRPSMVDSGAADVTVAHVMEPGPSTVRPDGLLRPLVVRMQKRDVSEVLVTTPQGRLIGVLFRNEAERVLAGEHPSQIWRDCDGCPGRWAADA